MSLPLRPALALALTAALGAQTTIPSAAARSVPNYYDVYALYGASTPAQNQSRTQWIYCTKDIGVTAMLVNSIQLRWPATIYNNNKATTLTGSIDMSIAPQSYTAVSSNFAANHGSNRLTVFSGTLSLPAGNQVPWPAPWLPPIVLSTPFAYAQPLGSSFVVEFAMSGNSAGSPYDLEAERHGPGAQMTVLPSCRFATGGASYSLSYRLPYVGGTWYCQYNNYPTNTPSFAAGIQIIGQLGPGMKWAGLTLPIRLSRLGLPVLDETCALATDVVLTTPLTYNSGAGCLLGPTISIPQDPSLGGQSFYSQAFALDTAMSGAVGLHAGTASKWTVGTAALGATVSGIQVAATGTNGAVFMGQVGTLLLNP